MTEKRNLFLKMLDVIYGDTVEEKAVVATQQEGRYKRYHLRGPESVWQ